MRGKPDCDKYKVTPEVKSLFATLPGTYCMKQKLEI